MVWRVKQATRCRVLLEDRREHPCRSDSRRERRRELLEFDRPGDGLELVRRAALTDRPRPARSEGLALHRDSRMPRDRHAAHVGAKIERAGGGCGRVPV